MVSIIITAFNNSNYIHDCLESVIESAKSLEFEILLAIDNCDITLNSVMEKYSNYINLRVFFFDQRNGTYILKNTMSAESKYENLIFFDSDDIMTKNMVQDVLHFLLKDVDLVKPMSFIFENQKEIDNVNLNKKRNTYGEGVFGIKKSVFNSLNGFEPWICAADTEFQYRVKKNDYKIQFSPRICFFYRVHNQSLTSSKDTGFKSLLRQRYSIIIRQKMKSNDVGPLTTLNIANKIEVNTTNYKNFQIYKITDDDFYKKINEIEENRLSIIQSIFDKEPRKTIEKNYIKKEQKNIDLFKFKQIKNSKKDNNKVDLRNEIETIKKNQNRPLLISTAQNKINRRINLPNINLRLP